MTETERDRLDLAISRTIERTIGAYAATRGHDRETTLGALLAAARAPGLNASHDVTIQAILELHPQIDRAELASRISAFIEADEEEARERDYRRALEIALNQEAAA